MILEIFNLYRNKGGEELIADKILDAVRKYRPIMSLRWNSNDWDKPEAPGKWGQVRRLFDNPDTAKQLESIIDKEKIQCLLCHNIYPIGSSSIYRVARKKNIPVIQFTHNFRPFSVNGTLWTGNEIAHQSLSGNFIKEIKAGAWQNSQLKSLLFAMMLKWQKYRGYHDVVTQWIAVSDFMRNKFIACGIPAKRITTLRHFWIPMPEMPDTSDGGYYLFLGRLVPEKGVRVLLDTWKALETKLGRKCPQLIIGGTGELQAAVEKEAHTNPKIRYAGFVSGEQKNKLIANCRAMLAPSVWWEPLGLVTYEAYDFGKAMLAAASGGLTETVMDKKSGFLHTPGDIDSFAESVISCEKLTPAARIELGERGREWLLVEADFNTWKQRMDRILDEVCQ